MTAAASTTGTTANPNAGTTIGTTGAPWRATVTPWGAVQPWDGTAVLDWMIGADDRWHVPAREASVRQRRVDGTPVVETAVRVPSGDAVQRVYAVPGSCVVEVENRSPLPFAVAFTRADLGSRRPPVDVPVTGIDLPPGAVTFGVPHQQSLVVTLAFERPAAGALPDAVPPADAVVRGWASHAERGSRVVLPDDPLVEALVGARCAVLLDPLGPDGQWAERLFRAAEWCRLGERPDTVLDAVVESAYRLNRSVRRDRVVHPSVVRALRAAGDTLALAGEERAARDVDAMAERCAAVASGPLVPVLEPRVVTALPPGACSDAVRSALLHDTGEAIELLPGLPSTWVGQGIEVHGLRTRWGRASWAVRWHGARPALLWDLDGLPAGTTVRCPGLDASWSRAGEARGEALLAAPAGTVGTQGSPTRSATDEEPPSFS